MVAAVGIVAFGPGCTYLAPPHQTWVEPEVTGRVVDGSTGEPLRRATVTRVQTSGAVVPVADKPGPRMAEAPQSARAGAEGGFLLPSVRSAQLFLDSYPADAITLRVSATGYETRVLTFTNIVYGTPRSPREPTVATGDIGLTRLP